MYRGIQGGIIANYGSEALYKVQSITAISPLRPVESDSERDRGRRQKQGEPAQTGFGAILEKECIAKTQSEVPSDIRVKTNGYDRMGTPVYLMIQMHEYSYPTT